MSGLIPSRDWDWESARIVPFCQKINNHGLHWVRAIDESEFQGKTDDADKWLVGFGFNVLTETFVQRRYMSAQGFRGRWRQTGHDRRSGMAWDHQVITAPGPGQAIEWLQVERDLAGCPKHTDLARLRLGLTKLIHKSFWAFGDQDFLVLAGRRGVSVWTFCQVPGLLEAEEPETEIITEMIGGRSWRAFGYGRHDDETWLLTDEESEHYHSS